MDKDLLRSREEKELEQLSITYGKVDIVGWLQSFTCFFSFLKLLYLNRSPPRGLKIFRSSLLNFYCSSASVYFQERQRLRAAHQSETEKKKKEVEEGEKKLRKQVQVKLTFCGFVRHFLKKFKQTPSPNADESKEHLSTSPPYFQSCES